MLCLIWLLVAVFFATTATCFDLDAQLQIIADRMANKYNCSISVAVHGGSRSGNISAVAAAGVKDYESGSICTPRDSFVWGSVTKVHTGSSVLRLVGDGKFSLDSLAAPLIDPMLASMNAENFSSLEDLFGPEVSRVTVRDLLGMTSGIPDFDTANWDGPAPVDSLRKSIYANADRSFEPTDLLSFPWVHTGNLSWSPGSCPKVFCYSSTNFLLLGLLLAHQRYPDPATQWNAYNQSKAFPETISKDFPTVRFAIRDSPKDFTPVHGYDMTSFNHKDPKKAIDVYNVAGVFAGWTASDVVGPASDMAKLTYDVYAPTTSPGHGSKIVRDGKLLSQMYSSSAETGYGLATFNLSKSTGQEGPEGVAYGHLGATYGYQSIVAYFPALDFSLAIASNIETDLQSQPSDTFCSVYNTIRAALHGQTKPPTCTFTTKGYYQKFCRCADTTPDPSPQEPIPPPSPKEPTPMPRRPKSRSGSSGCTGLRERTTTQAKRTLALPDPNTGVEMNRTYYVYGGSTSTPSPLVLNLHGYFSFNFNQDAALNEMTEDKMPNVTAQLGEDWIIVYPLGSGGEAEGVGNTYSWNIRGNNMNSSSHGPSAICKIPREKKIQYMCYKSCGHCDPENSCNFASCQDDHAFLRQLLFEIKSTYCVDNNRVHIVGFSTGGMMAYDFAALYSSEIASIAVAEANQFQALPLAPKRPVSLLDMHGFRDMVMPANASEASGVTPRGALVSDDNFFYAPLSQTLQRWSANARCEAHGNRSFDPLPIGVSLPDTAEFGCRLPFGRCGTNDSVIIAACSGNWTHRWPLYDYNKTLYSALALNFFRRTPQTTAHVAPVMQTPVQQAVMRKVAAVANSTEHAELNLTLRSLDTVALRRLLRELRSPLAGWSASEMLQSWKANWQTVEMVHGFNLAKPQFDDQSAILRPLPAGIATWHNQWALPFVNSSLGIINPDRLAYYSLESIVETAFFMFPAFSVSRRGVPGGMPGGLAEAIDRPIYTAANVYRLSLPTSHWGKVALVLNSSFSNARAVLAPTDTGLYTAVCNGDFEREVCNIWKHQSVCDQMFGCAWQDHVQACMHDPSVVPDNYNCSAWDGRVGAGTHAGHLISSFVELTGAQSRTTRLATLLARALQPWSTGGGPLHLVSSNASSTLTFEADVAARISLPENVKLVLADFSLFGTPTATTLMRWASDHRLPLAWALGTPPTGIVADGRILDPTLVKHSNLNISVDLANANLTFWRFWKMAQDQQPWTNRTTMTKMFFSLQSDLPGALRIEPLFLGSCGAPHQCVGIIEETHDCVCRLRS